MTLFCSFLRSRGKQTMHLLECCRCLSPFCSGQLCSFTVSGPRGGESLSLELVCGSDGVEETSGGVQTQSSGNSLLKVQSSVQLTCICTLPCKEILPPARSFHPEGFPIPLCCCQKANDFRSSTVKILFLLCVFRQHLGQLYAAQAEMWDTVSTVSALSLESASQNKQ